VKLITLEGIDGSGKTYQSALLAQWLKENGHQAMALKAPYVKDIKDLTMKDYDQDTKALLYLADLHNLTNQIEPLLTGRRKGFVIIDRYFDSFYAYQIYGAGLNYYNDLYERFYTIKPSLTILLDIEVDKAIERIEKRDEAGTDDRESLSNSLFNIQCGYQSLAYSNPERITVVNSNFSEQTVQERIRKVFSAHFEL
jgi:dTMP kinase